MMMGIAGLVLASNLVMPVADGVPNFNVQQTCQGVRVNVAQGRNRDGCLRDERDARAKLKDEWSGFAPSERSRCRQLSSLGGLPSYVELLTCLQIAKQANNLPAETAAKKLGRGK